jgi:hypothetical protein
MGEAQLPGKLGNDRNCLARSLALIYYHKIEEMVFLMGRWQPSPPQLALLDINNCSDTSLTCRTPLILPQG